MIDKPTSGIKKAGERTARPPVDSVIFYFFSSSPFLGSSKRFFLSTNLPVLTSKASLDFLFMIITITTTAIAIPAMTAITMIIGFVPFESFSYFSA